jgi:hypothetical protein
MKRAKRRVMQPLVRGAIILAGTCQQIRSLFAPFGVAILAV